MLQIIFNTTGHLTKQLKLRNVLLLLFLWQMVVKFNKMVYSTFYVLLLLLFLWHNGGAEQ